MPPPLTYEYNPLSYEYPDDETEKELFLLASSKTAHPAMSSARRTVFIYWVNTVFPDGEEVWQVVRLAYREDENGFRYAYPDMIVVDESARQRNATYSLGTFTRDQRELVLECADDIEYVVRPVQADAEEQCWRWMGQLLEHMVEQGLVGHAVVDSIRAALPLPPDL